MFEILTIVLAVAFVIVVQRASRAPARVIDNRLVVEYPAPARALGVVACVLVAVFIVRVYGAGYPVQFLLAVLALGVVIVLMALTWGLTRISFDAELIRTFSIWRGRRAIPWTDLRAVSAGISGWTVHTTGHGGIRFNHLQRGCHEFREALRLNTLAPGVDRK
jgi:hypothetical protein